MLKDHLSIFFWEASIQYLLPILIGSFPWQVPPLSSGLTIWQLWFSGSPGKKHWVFPCVALPAASHLPTVEFSLMLEAGKQKCILCSSPCFLLPHVNFPPKVYLHWLSPQWLRWRFLVFCLCFLEPMVIQKSLRLSYVDIWYHIFSLSV